MRKPEWNGFTGGSWETEINVRDFIQKNYTPYDGDGSFLAGPTQNTKDLWNQVLELSQKSGKLAASWIWTPRDLHHHLPRPRLLRPIQRDHRRFSDRQTF